MKEKTAEMDSLKLQKFNNKLENLKNGSIDEIHQLQRQQRCT
jgi:hypothetical protein